MCGCEESVEVEGVLWFPFLLYAFTSPVFYILLSLFGLRRVSSLVG